MENINENNVPKRKVVNGIPYVLDEETQTYLPFGDEDEEEEPIVIGRFGKLREKYLKENFKGTYSTMLLLNTLTPHLQAIDEQAWERFDQIVKELAEADGTNEELKATDQMKWVGLMNNYRETAREMVIKEIIETGISDII
ncbi:TnpV protein [Ruminococcus sp.]|uniref:TnpV protein n=1 Tax=Ruminococcus sp. TaxID=41978 RepID=UPI0025D419A5|nr:TnpV protein [Ruminococcus sp.]MBQ6252458.1 TnpV protein [Ruminococcus sp.]